MGAVIGSHFIILQAKQLLLLCVKFLLGANTCIKQFITVISANRLSHCRHTSYSRILQ